MTLVPSPEAQLSFLTKLQRLFAEGDFTATYKFALIIALADLAVELGADDGGALRLSNRSIAAKFIELYWQQTAPYSTGRAGTAPGVLAQNNGANAAVLTVIAEFRQSSPVATPLSARTLAGYPALIRRVADTVSAQPLQYLQNLGGQRDQFLYERARGVTILLPGVHYCLRRFQPLVQQLARSRWIDHIKRNRLNGPLLGEADDLEAFLFETPRQTLAEIGAGLRLLNGSRCFYCGSTAHEVDVDHFVPFSLYPRDLIHNFVLAHPACNRSKSDTLAALPHLERWLEHITRHHDSLQEIGHTVGRPADRVASRSVATWGYANAASSGAQAWLRAGLYEPVGASYTNCFV
ncbi:HNH nuclease [Rubrivivax sp. A210]|uniref:HNH endonuclease n=1 Tax=Rubrivivax sp. A210 TaxID=2772301 RepID=UPI001919FE24|nr:HNH endonuclease [Rubrivivax sp. A210]CAD5366921.1 HNH nuclease [Rubrivivax sp. A210]